MDRRDIPARDRIGRISNGNSGAGIIPSQWQMLLYANELAGHRVTTREADWIWINNLTVYQFHVRLRLLKYVSALIFRICASCADKWPLFFLGIGMHAPPLFFLLRVSDWRPTSDWSCICACPTASTSLQASSTVNELYGQLLLLLLSLQLSLPAMDNESRTIIFHWKSKCRWGAADFKAQIIVLQPS